MSADKNMTGEQIQQIMDMFLYKALEPLVLYTNIFDPQVEYLLLLVATNRKRKLSSLDRGEAVEKLAAYLSVQDRKQKFEFIRAARVERFFIHKFLISFTEQNMGYVKRYKEFLLNPTKEKKIALDRDAVLIGMCERSALYNTLQICNAYLKRFYVYRNSVVDLYVKNANKWAKAHVIGAQGRSSFKDLVQSIIKAVITAMDKYDSRKGALTSYVTFWTKNAMKASKEHEYGVAYTVPQAQKKKLFEGTSHHVNFSVSLDTIYGDDDDEGSSMALHSVLAPGHTLEKGIEVEQSRSLVQMLAKKVDPMGIARLSLDIGEHFTPEEQAIMRQHMLEEKL
jgi:hypothetical protein